MKKMIILGLIFLAILALILILMTGNLRSESYIKKEIEKANYCDVKEDCIDAGGKCPFGCNIYANKDEVDRIKGMVSSFESDCVYDCMYCPDVECKNHRCEPICQ